jgi:hypothetical protein
MAESLTAGNHVLAGWIESNVKPGKLPQLIFTLKISVSKPPDLNIGVKNSGS